VLASRLRSWGEAGDGGRGERQRPRRDATGNARWAAAADRQRAVHQGFVVRKSARAAEPYSANDTALCRHQRRCQSAESWAGGFRSRPDHQRDGPHPAGTRFPRRTRLRNSGNGEERTAGDAGFTASGRDSTDRFSIRPCDNRERDP